ncbi:DUF1850 domain-containing protein [Marivita sp. GX14005]|uniref:DUF1850 domain-containing protein n=1 Tax=Marivita sp. GX14005 TaxID=2942276 RepID=UPI002018958E|nr:DUF1850 domain-containing protein [Marivita sp. GX14005]MCL3882692.1 DUF1850 domain-containing protein [Marivita sp. GX14005]
MAALFVLAGPAAPDILRVTGPDGTALFTHPAPERTQWCLTWNHSVTGGPVADCFANRGGRMILTRSYLHDFAAGLGEVEGRGRLRSAAEGGYWIESIDEPIKGNTLPLRVGSASTDHRLRIGGTQYVLSQMAAGARVAIHLTDED